MRWCSCSVRTYLGALLLLPRANEAHIDAPLMVSSFAGPAELALTLLAKCSELFLLHAADCVDDGLLCEDEGT